MLQFISNECKYYVSNLLCSVTNRWGCSMYSEKSISQHIGQSLSQLRLDAGLTVFQLSKMAGMESEQQLYRYENGVDDIGMEELVIALNALSVDIEDFFLELDKIKTLVKC